MKSGHKDDYTTKISVSQFAQLVRYIKDKRPNIKVGIYTVCHLISIMNYKKQIMILKNYVRY